MCLWIFAELHFEESPKWFAVKEMLSEVEAEIENNHQTSADNYSSAGRVMLVAQDDRTCSQIRDVRLIFSLFLMLDFSMIFFLFYNIV